MQFNKWTQFTFLHRCQPEPPAQCQELSASGQSSRNSLILLLSLQFPHQSPTRGVLAPAITCLDLLLLNTFYVSVFRKMLLSYCDREWTTQPRLAQVFILWPSLGCQVLTHKWFHNFPTVTFASATQGHFPPFRDFQAGTSWSICRKWWTLSEKSTQLHKYRLGSWTQWAWRPPTASSVRFPTLHGQVPEHGRTDKYQIIGSRGRQKQGEEENLLCGFQITQAVSFLPRKGYSKADETN